MEILFTILAILTLLGFLFLLLKPKIQPKSKEQKQEEIRQNFLQRLDAELSATQNPDERQTKKIALLKVFAKELEFNLFFDKDEVKVLIQELAGY
ncbi:hypothetical protein FA592_04575 [Sulfurospirillum diekertiae]|uniref:Uncharacterized protein n=1 Tax=Sulfurospirillum diekertiae TaxID=1854492 RepID=A0A6G9VT37_9BACT|nr:hypothetical protein [Sulfurospirillum diekertiae]QIR75535.1 hypothetical protein FA584_04670 [Sulfurospirillum diekertiae]QIR78184.1 hypothetical protein FA592_04575 [Sulfurospirillum diekertiae]